MPHRATTSAEDADALSVSEQIFGPRVQRDDAYGAFQRGYFLTALALALPRAENNDAAAQTLIAEIYAKGLGVAENLAQASGWYALASKNGDPLATFELALLYQEGRGVPQQPRQAPPSCSSRRPTWATSPAKYNLALLHVEGIYAAPEPRRGRRADQGGGRRRPRRGAVRLRHDADRGRRRRRPTRAKGARRSGSPPSRAWSAPRSTTPRCSISASGVAPRSSPRRVGWYKRAADAGNPVAQNRYAKLLAVGEGVDLDLEEAAMWRALARRQGLTDPVLDKLLVSITRRSSPRPRSAPASGRRSRRKRTRKPNCRLHRRRSRPTQIP